MQPSEVVMTPRQVFLSVLMFGVAGLLLFVYLQVWFEEQRTAFIPISHGVTQSRLQTFAFMPVSPTGNPRRVRTLTPGTQETPAKGSMGRNGREIPETEQLPISAGLAAPQPASSTATAFTARLRALQLCVFHGAFSEGLNNFV
ncbi:hypothetical protein CB1_000954025 [Camelus ferus]|nr:hypothetical protein CB1_000954025 [Camelus ferus]